MISILTWAVLAVLIIGLSIEIILDARRDRKIIARMKSRNRHNHYH